MYRNDVNNYLEEINRKKRVVYGCIKRKKTQKFDIDYKTIISISVGGDTLNEKRDFGTCL